MRWLMASEQFKKFALTDGALDELKYWLWSGRALVKHYLYERYCENCNGKWCKRKDAYFMLKECRINNHCHWQDGRE